MIRFNSLVATIGDRRDACPRNGQQGVRRRNHEGWQADRDRNAAA
jgi:hypothetical protein